MKSLKFLLALSLFFFSCAKKPVFLTYKDQKYPLSIQYLKHKMLVEPYKPDEKYNSWTNVNVDISEEFPQEVDLRTYETLYQIIIYAPETFTGWGKLSYEIKESELNGIPVIVLKDKKKQKAEYYILLIPGVYAEVRLSGVDIRRWNPEEISQERSDRIEQLTYEMVKYFKWNQEININSEEFKKWKQHIWEILKSGKKK